MIKSTQQIITDIKDYIKKCGGNFQEWYIGIASNPEERLFDQHNVRRDSNWIYVDCGSQESARNIEKYFMDNFAMEGGGSGGEVSTTNVYAYRITPYTKDV